MMADSYILADVCDKVEFICFTLLHSLLSGLSTSNTSSLALAVSNLAIIDEFFSPIPVNSDIQLVNIAI